MALRVWLPLNGNSKNKGLLGDIATTTTPTYTTAGKIGQALATGGFKMSASQTEQALNNNEVTIAFWIYVKVEPTDSTKYNAILFGQDAMTPPNNRKFSIFQYPTCNDLHLSWQNETSGTFIGSIDTGVLPSYKWTHVCIVYKNPVATVYINGEQYITHSGVSNSSSFAFDTQLIHSNSNRYINDFRIYDEALSVKQIKEISKGLVAHYKLEGPGANPNLLLHADKYLKNSPRIKTGTGTDLYDTPGVYYNGLDTSKYYIYSMCCDGTLATAHGGTSTTDATKKYWTAWLYYQDTPYSDSSYSSYQTPVCYHANCSSDSNMYLGNIGNRYYWRVKPPYANCSVRVNAYSNGTDSVSVKFWDFKLEEGTKLTTWLPNQADTLYNTFDYNNMFAEDSSGNGYNAIESGTLTFNSNSPRYSGSTKFDSGYLHQIPSPLSINSDAFTIGCWFYPTQNAAMCLINDRKSVGDGLAVFYLGGGIRFDTGSSYQWQVGSITVNAWNHVVVTWDKNAGNKKLYLNGNLINTTTNYGTLAQIGDVFSIGNSSTNGAAGAGNQIYGSLSDFRIYATALSANDILTMYKNSGIIDNKGNVYAYEFKEE